MAKATKSATKEKQAKPKAPAGPKVTAQNVQQAQVHPETLKKE